MDGEGCGLLAFSKMEIPRSDIVDDEMYSFTIILNMLFE